MTVYFNSQIMKNCYENFSQSFNWGISNFNANTPYNQPSKNLDECSFQAKISQNKRVTFTEGTGLIFKGIGQKALDMVKTFITHPIKALGTIAVTAGVLMALPFIGIPTAAGASALAIVFAGFSALNMGKDILNAVKSSENGDNNELRNNLKNIGGSALDLALSLPFVPRAFKIIQNQVKYGKAPAFNSALWENIKKQKNVMTKIKEVRTADSALIDNTNYLSGIDKLQKQLNFSDEIKQKYLDLRKYSGKEFIEKAYAQMTEDLGYGKNAPELEITKERNSVSTGGYYFERHKIVINEADSPVVLLRLIRHELQHFQQMVDFERAKGAGLGLENMLFEKLAKKALGCSDLEFSEKQRDTVVKMIMDKYSMSLEPYRSLAKKQGPISADSKRYLDLVKFQSELYDYQGLGILDEQLEQMSKTKALKSQKQTFKESCKEAKKAFGDLGRGLKAISKYLNQSLEKDARKAESIFSLTPNITYPYIVYGNILAQNLEIKE